MSIANLFLKSFVAISVHVLFVLLTVYDGYAQCGSLGDPIIDIDFGQGEPNFGTGASTYQYVNGGPGDGQYTLSKNANFNNGWHNMADHSGSGYMLVVNADDNQTGEFYRIQVEGLCENTNFYFSAYVANINTPEQVNNPCNGNLQLPNVKFLILDNAGNEIVSLDTTDVPVSASPQWREYGVFFNTGNQTEFQLVLINNNIGGCGNDLAIDDIQFRPCGPQITLETDISLKQVDTLFFCESVVNPIQIGSKINSNDGYMVTPVFQWQTRQDDQATWHDIDGQESDQLQIVPVHNQWYRLTVAATADNLENPLCRVSSDSIRVAQIVQPQDITEVEVLDPLCDDGSIALDPPEYIGADIGPVTYQWQLDEGQGAVDIDGADSSMYLFQARETGTVRLLRQAINVCGDAFITHVFEIEVTETVRTTLMLPQDAICADDEPLLLSGGIVINSDGEGVYSGNGVVDGRFYPASAGVGEHIITFSPPSGTLCAEPSQGMITVLDSIYLEPMADIVMLQGQTITLHPQTNASQFSWSNQPGLDNYHIRDPIASPNETTTYTLTAGNVGGCEKTADITVTVLKDLVVPNAFTPNGDGFNDTWEIDGLEEYPNVFIQVFNRWGTLVFSSKGYSIPWNGSFNGAPLPMATYYYTLSSDVLTRPISGSVSILK